MERLPVDNPFHAPVYYADTVDSTMEVSRALARGGAPHGTVIAADFQRAGRGRLRERAWHGQKGANLAVTVLLRFPGIEDIPPAFTLRAGLAVSRAIEDFAFAGGESGPSGGVLIKWPNDVLMGGRKVAGILAEADGGDVHTGIGVNVAQKQFPAALRDTATSISLAAGREIAGGERYRLLERILTRLHAGMNAPAADDWRACIEARLYHKGRRVCFVAGPAGAGEMVMGILAGIGPGGELRLMPDGGGQEVSFTTGELRFR